MTVAALSEHRNATVRHRRYRSQLSFLARARGLRAAVTLRELLNATGSIDKFLLAGEKRMAGRADTDSNVAPGRAGLINRAARANDVGLVIFWVNACFHVRK